MTREQQFLKLLEQYRPQGRPSESELQAINAKYDEANARDPYVRLYLDLVTAG